MADYSYYQGESKRRIPLLWKDFDGSIIDFSVAGWTYTVELANDGELATLGATPQVTGFGPNATPNIVVRFMPGTFTLVPPMVYDLIVTATKDSEPFVFYKTRRQVPTLEVLKDPV